jgi:hypothetical protein
MRKIGRSPIGAFGDQFGRGKTRGQAQAFRSGGLRGHDAVGRVLDHQAVGRRKPETLDGEQEDLRVGLLVDNLKWTPLSRPRSGLNKRGPAARDTLQRCRADAELPEGWELRESYLLDATGFAHVFSTACRIRRASPRSVQLDGRAIV